MSNFSLEFPINNLSFGNCSINLLREFFKKGLNPPIFLIGEKADVSSFDSIELEFVKWIERNAKTANEKHSRNSTSIKLWHINGSMSSVSKKQNLFTFYELDSPTELEINTLKNQDKVLVSSSYTKEVFEQNGISNVTHCPLGFDSHSFKKLERKKNEDKIIFGLAGKLEKRKQHHKVLKAWAKKYGNNPMYMLNCAITNPFLQQDQQASAISSILENKNYFNINFLPFIHRNSEYNHYLNSNDIIIGMSAGEGWGLPEFQSLCLGKHGVILNAHAYKDWANKENCVMVEPSSKIESYDGVFFHKGAPVNQGMYYDWNEDEFISACETAEKRYSKSKLNKEGEKLKEEFSWEKTANAIISSID
jgi:glycosyltransferase involved in cell wall biosynthesis